MPLGCSSKITGQRERNTELFSKPLAGALLRSQPSHGTTLVQACRAYARFDGPRERQSSERESALDASTLSGIGLIAAK